MVRIYRSDLHSETFPGTERHAVLLESWMDMDGKDFVEVEDDFFKPPWERQGAIWDPGIKKLRHKRRTHPSGWEYDEAVVEKIIHAATKK